MAFVDIYFDGTSGSWRFDCVAGLAVLDVAGFAPGVYPVTVEGIGSDGLIYDRSLPFSVTVGECGDFYAAPVLGEALLNIDYHFVPDVCHGGSMWFALYDEVAQDYISVVDAQSDPAWKEYYGCWDSGGGGTPLEFPVPFGTYTLAWIQEVVNPLTAPTAVQQACVQAPFDVASPGVAFLSVVLADNTVAPQACPVYP